MMLSTYVKKADARYETDFAELPQVSQEYLVNYGFRQAIADACASAKTEGEAKGLCDKRFDNLLKGILRAERESDPVAREARRLAVEKTNAWAKANGVALVAKADANSATVAQVEKNQAVYLDRVNKLKVHPVIVAQAQANVDALAGLDIDIDI